jgi:hypothetical protein
MIWVLGEDDPGNGLLSALTSHLAPQDLPQHARH